MSIDHKVHTVLLAGASLLAMSAPALAQEPAALDEIVVTAQKREQGYTDVPVSVATVSGEQLENAQANNFQDLVQLSPSITFSPDRGMRGAGVLIRGLGTTAFQVSVEPTVSTVVDGVALGRTGAFLSSLTDVERVEVLRGPQGTLFGKNASAGVVNIITKRPTDYLEGSVRVIGTSDNQKKVEAMLSGPLSDSVRGRVNLLWNDYAGNIDNRFNGEKLNGEESLGARVKLDADFSERVNLLLTGDYIKQDRNCCAYTVRSTGTDAFLANALSDIEVGPFSTDVFLNTPVKSDSRQGGVSAEFNVDFDNFVLTSISAWRFWKLVNEQDIDGHAFTQPTNGRALFFTTNGQGENGDQMTKQISEELRITTTGWDNVNLTAGIFFWRQTLDRYFQRESQFCPPPLWNPALPFGSPCPGGGTTFFGSADFSVDSTSVAGFGQADWQFAEGWTAIMGLRYTYDKQSIFMDRFAAVPGPAIPPTETFSNSDSGTGISGKFALQRDIGDDAMVYASYARGYKAQAFDLIFGSTAARTATPVPEETSDAFEAGLKGEFFDRRLRLGVTGFYTLLHDFQGQTLDPVNLAFILTSAGEAVTRGVEMDFTALPAANLTLSGGVSYTDAYYKEFAGAQCYGGQTVAEGCVGGVQDLSGMDVPNSPDWKLTLQGRYDIPLEGPVDLFVNSAYRWQSSFLPTGDLQPDLEIGSYGVFDLSAGLQSDDGRWQATLFAKNLFNDHYADQLVQTPFDNDTTVMQSLPRDFERYFGGSISYRFGVQ